MATADKPTRHTFDTRAQFTRAPTSDAWIAIQIEDARRKVQRDLRRGFWLRLGMAAVAALAIVVVLMAALGP